MSKYDLIGVVDSSAKGTSNAMNKSALKKT